MKTIKDIVYVEKYTSKWEEKKKYTKVWILLTKEDGSQSINMFGSWLNVYDQKKKDDDSIPF